MMATNSRDRLEHWAGPSGGAWLGHGLLWAVLINESEKESASRSVVWTLCDPMDYTVHGILQARKACPFSRRPSQRRDWAQVSHFAGGFLTSWATKEAQECWSGQPIPSPGGLPNPGTKVSCTAGGLLTSWAIEEALPILRAPPEKRRHFRGRWVSQERECGSGRCTSRGRGGVEVGFAVAAAAAAGPPGEDPRIHRPPGPRELPSRFAARTVAPWLQGAARTGAPRGVSGHQRFSAWQLPAFIPRWALRVFKRTAAWAPSRTGLLESEGGAQRPAS